MTYNETVEVFAQVIRDCLQDEDDTWLAFEEAWQEVFGEESVPGV